MDLTHEQKQTVASWVAERMGLAEVQRRLESEMGLRMTYMDVRFLIDDLMIEIPEPPKPDPSAEMAAPPVMPEPVPEGVSVTVDKLARPGALVSGQVVFSDGQKATWLLDQMGQLGLDGAPPDYRPSDEDLQDFQKKLQNSLRQAGLA